MRGLCGFLLPDGRYFECESWEHLSTAVEICQNVYQKDFDNSRGKSLEAENYLFEIGCVAFYARSSEHRWINSDKQVLILTDMQRDFIIKHLKNANNNEQKESLLELLEWDDGYRESNLLSIRNSFSGIPNDSRD